MKSWKTRAGENNDHNFTWILFFSSTHDDRFLTCTGPANEQSQANTDPELPLLFIKSPLIRVAQGYHKDKARPRNSTRAFFLEKILSET